MPFAIIVHPDGSTAYIAVAGSNEVQIVDLGTFSVTNLGVFGIQSFTPVIDAPQVGILGVGTIEPKPVMVDGEPIFVPTMGLSLTIDHQVVDGAPAARFLQDLAGTIAEIDLTLAQ